jgi:ORF6C domain/ORF6N domain
MSELKIIEQNGARVLTTAQLSESYGADSERIVKNFNRNRDRYKANKHYVFLEGDDLKAFKATGQIDLPQNLNRLYLWTEKGAWLHAKSLNTDLAWDAYEMLVDDYYQKREQVKVLSEKEQRVELLKLTLEHEEKFMEYNGRLQKLEDNVRIDSFQQNVIQKQIKKRVYKVFENHNPNDLEVKKLFPCIHRNFRDSFGVPTYKDLRKLDFEDALAWVKAWRPLI